MSANVPDAWDDEWSSVADVSSRNMLVKMLILLQNSAAPHEQADSKKVSSKVTKAQKRAQQAEFNRQVWAEASVSSSTSWRHWK